MAMFGMYGTYQENQYFIQFGNSSYTFSAARAFRIGWQGRNDAITTINWSDTNATDLNEADSKTALFLNTSVSTLTNKRDGRHKQKNADLAKGSISGYYYDRDFLTEARQSGEGAMWLFLGWVGHVAPVTGTFVFHRPDLITDIETPGVFGAAGTGNCYDGVTYGIYPYKIPRFINLRSITLISAGATGQQYNFRSIIGAIPEKVISFQLIAQTDFTSIQYAFPKSLVTLSLAVPNATFAADLARLIAECYNVEYFALSYALSSESMFNPVPVTGILDLYHMPKIRRLQISSISLTNILIALNTPQIKNLQLRSCYNLNSGTFDYLLTCWKADADREFLNLVDCRRAFDIVVNDDIRIDFIGLFLWSNYNMTGSLNITTLRTTFVGLKLGTFTEIIDATRSTITPVNISGVMGTNDIDLSNCNIASLILPTTTVTTILKVGGGKLDVISQPTLLAEFSKITNLASLYLSTGTASGNGLSPDFSYVGQDSVNGLGNNPDFSGCTRLVTFYAKSCKMTGEINLSGSQTTLQNMIISTNDLTGVFGVHTFTNLRGIYGSWNYNFTFDFTRCPTLQAFGMIQTAQVHIDLSARTNTVNGWSQVGIAAINNPNLTTITFPSTPGAFRFPVNININLQMYGNPLLATITNWENITFDINPGFVRNIQIQVQNTAIKTIPIAGLIVPPYYIDISNCGMNNSEVNAILNAMFTRRSDYDTALISTGRVFTSTGTNAPLSGTYQAPTGFKIATITAITNAAVCRVTVSAIGTLAENDVMTIRYVAGMTQVNVQTYMIKNIVTNSFDLYTSDGLTPIDSTAFGVRTAGGIISIEGSPASEKEKLYVLRTIYSISGGSIN